MLDGESDIISVINLKCACFVEREGSEPIASYHSVAMSDLQSVPLCHYRFMHGSLTSLTCGALKTRFAVLAVITNKHN